MQILFSQKNMLLCDIQDNKNGLLVKTIKKNYLYTSSRACSHFSQASNLQCRLSVFE